MATQQTSRRRRISSRDQIALWTTAWAAAIDGKTGMPAPHTLASLIKHGRRLPLKGPDLQMLEDLRFLHAYLAHHFGQEYADLIKK